MSEDFKRCAGRTSASQPDWSAFTTSRYMLRRYTVQLLLLLALLARTASANFTLVTSVTHQLKQPLRVAFAPHPFLSHWAVSAPIAQELLSRGHKVLVRLEMPPLDSEHSKFALCSRACSSVLFTHIRASVWQTRQASVADEVLTCRIDHVCCMCSL